MNTAAGRETDQARHERLALSLALSLRDPAFQQAVHRAVEGSRFRERKIHFQALLGANGRSLMHDVAGLASRSPANLERDLDESPELELYFPVAEHRRRWRAGDDVLVATAIRDHDAPVAFDPSGRRIILSPESPPETPVLMLGPAETSFDIGSIDSICVDNCQGTGGGSTTPAPGLYLTRTQFKETFESWFKGSPEFEVHVLGKDPAGNRLKTYQCTGEHAGAPYVFDQNNTTWSGSVLLFSQQQLNTYRAEQPGHNLRLLVVEDDDTACQIRVDSTRTYSMLQQIDAAYGGLTGGKDTTFSLVRAFKKANAFIRIVTAVANIFKTNDDPVGNAVEDLAAGNVFPGANWLIRGENLVTNGAIRLEMR